MFKYKREISVNAVNSLFKRKSFINGIMCQTNSLFSVQRHLNASNFFFWFYIDYVALKHSTQRYNHIMFSYSLG